MAKQTMGSSNGKGGGVGFADDREDQPKHDKLGERPVLKVPATFGGVSFGKTTCAVRCKIDRNRISDGKVMAFLVNSRLDITMAVDAEAELDDPNQEVLIDTADVKLNSVADVHRASVGADDISVRLTFSKESVDAETLTRFSNQAGAIIVAKIGYAGDEPAGEAAAGDDD